MGCNRGLQSAASPYACRKREAADPLQNFAEFRVGTGPSRARITEADPTPLERSVFRIFGPS